MTRYFREDFDRSREFIVLRNLFVRGQTLYSGQPLDKSLFSERRLRQLYDQRYVGYGMAAPRRGGSPEPVKALLVPNGRGPLEEVTVSNGRPKAARRNDNKPTRAQLKPRRTLAQRGSDGIPIGEDEAANS